MKWSEAEKTLRQSLTALYPEGEAAAIAGRVMEALTGRTYSQRMMQEEAQLTQEQVQQWQAHQNRLLQQEPVQYVLQQAPFYGMELYVDRSVLIPRPETEELVHWIIEDVRKNGPDVFTKNATDADRTSELKILDIGTGSGCIPLALKKAMPLAEVWGCDVSEEALTVARRNSSHLDIRVDFQGVDILDEAQHRLLPSVDILVSNPPYIPQNDAAAMHPNVLAYEPHLALFVPNDDALLFYKAIARFSHHRLHAGGRIYLEVHEEGAKEVTALFTQEGYSDVVVKKDMQGKERMLRVKKA
jgi:release factor glutamine methyltransferase